MAIKYEKIVEEDLNLGYGAAPVTSPQGGTLAGNKIGLHTFGKGYNVKDFGARGDGATNDAASVQAAIDAAEAASGTAFFPAGTYKINTGVTVDTSNISLVGEGGQSKIKGGVAGINLVQLSSVTGVRISDLTFEGDGTLQAGDANYRALVKLVSSSRCIVSNCNFLNWNTDGLHLTLSFHNRVESCYFSGLATGATVGVYAAIQLRSAGGNTISGNVIAGGFREGILLQYWQDYTFDGETHRDSRYNAIQGNYIYGGYNHSIYESPGRQNAYVGNNIRATAGSSSIKLAGTDALVAGNQLHGGGNGIELQNHLRAVVSGNYITNVSGYGIVMHRTVEGPIEGVVIQGNHINEPGVLGIYGNPTSTTYAEGIVVADNLIRLATPATRGMEFTGIGIEWRKLTISGNVVTYGGDGTTSRDGIFLRTGRDFVVMNNVLSGWARAGAPGTAGIRLRDCAWGVVRDNVQTASHRTTHLQDCANVEYDGDLQHDTLTEFEHYDSNTGVIQTLAVNSATPDVRGHRKGVWKTANVNPTTIASLVGGYLGQKIVVVFGDANTTVDFTGTTLKGNVGADWTPAATDHMTCVFDGTNWYCDISDNT